MHCCCVTGDRSLYCTVLHVHIVDNVVDADTNTIYYTVAYLGGGALGDGPPPLWPEHKIFLNTLNQKNFF